MNARLGLWCAPLLIWCLFTYWYTDFGGPLSEAEIKEGLAVLQARGFDDNRLAKLESFLADDTGRQFLMVNNIDMNDNPPLMPGFETGATASDYLDHYMEHMYQQLLKRACHPVFFGRGQGGVLDLVGIEGAAADGWETGALVRYRSRRTFLEIVSHPDMQGRHEYKLAAMTKTIAYPVEPVLYFSDPRLLLFLVLALVAAMADIFLFGRRHG